MLWAMATSSNAQMNGYEITVSSPHGLKVVEIDPQSGNILAVKSTSSNALAADGLPKSGFRQAEQAKTGLADAVAAAEKDAGHPALEAGYVMRSGQLTVDVDIASNGKVASYRVNPSSGNVTGLSQTENERQEGGGELAEDAD